MELESHTTFFLFINFLFKPKERVHWQPNSKGMGMFAINKEGEVTVSFKNDINLNDFYKPDQLADVTTEQSTSLKRRKVGNLKLQTTFSFKYLLSQNSGSKEEVEDLFNKRRSPTILLQKPELMFSPTSSAQLDLAAIMLQKVYKSYRIRRNLADCAVVCEELWWKDSVITANRCSVSHFDSDISETAISKWARARMMAAMVGKGLSKDDKAQKLALRHWLEAIDPRHRYGHNLHFYYEVWFRSLSYQPFFYWLDVGDGKEVNLETCPRRQLQRQCIKYLGPKEREAYEVIVEGGRLVYRQSKDLVHTTEESKWIFVLSSSRILYVGQKKKGQFQHSSFLAGGATIASGRILAQNGVLHAIWPYSGHYRPTEKNFMEFICFLEEHKVDMTNVQKDPIDEDVPPSKPDNEDMEGNVGASDSGTANNYGKENVEASVEENNLPMSSKWSTGVGPRIGCVREYPTKIQVQALEQLNLPPRVNHATFSGKAPIPSPRPSTKHLSPRLVNMGLPSPMTSTDQEKGGENKSKKKWRLWRASSEGSMKKLGAAAVPDSSLTYAVAVMVPKDFKLIKKEWAAIRIQAVFRAFLARRALRALRAVVRLQAIFRGRLVRKQAAVTLRCMQALVRVQARVRARNVRNSPEGKAVQKLLDEHRNQADPANQVELGWCDIPGTVDEVKAKLRMRQEGAIKRDRAMAYSLSTQSRLIASPNTKATKALTPLKHHNLNKSLGCSLLERWMEAKPWESPISRKSEDVVPAFQSRRNGVTTRISVKPITTNLSTPSSSAISSEYMCDDSPVSTSYASGSTSLPSTNTILVEATEERDVHQPSYMNLTESTKAKLKTCRSSSQNSKRLVMEECVSHSTTTGFMNGDTRSSSGSDPSVNLWKDSCATPLRASYQKRQIRISSLLCYRK
ncbi:IQ domain-containing protein IQM5, partial [Mucuna pruriens]